MKNGPYILVKAPPEYPGKKYRGKYCYEHHLVYWKHHGITRKPNQCIHHINGNTHDNRIENLQMKKWRGHSQEHHSKKSPIQCICEWCEKKYFTKR